MRKLKNKAGFSLIELLCALLILVLLVMGIGTGMDAGMNIYEDATFEAESASLAGILNTSLGDILRYSQNIRINNDKLEDSSGSYVVKEDVGFVFTNIEYGIQDAYFYTPMKEGNVSMGVLQMKNLRNANVVELVNTGAYPDLVISNFKIVFYDQSETGVGGGYFTVKYDIFSATDMQKVRKVEMIVRLMND